MPTAKINGIDINYEVHGSGPPLLMLAPGGFDATLEKFRNASVWAKMDTFGELGKQYQVIAFDRREAGLSGGRVESLTWELYADEARGMLDHFGIDKAFVLGGCMGCSVGIAFANRYPERTRGLLLHWPVGGYFWRRNAFRRFDLHYSFLKENGFDAVVEVAKANPGFWADSRAGLWSAVLSHDTAFAESFVQQDLDRYLAITHTSAKTLFDRDTAPGCEPEELNTINVPTLIIPGGDDHHTKSAAHYLNEVINDAEFWDIPTSEQEALKVADRLRDFGKQH